MVPRAVAAEIHHTQMSAPRREYPYATLFRHLRTFMAEPPGTAPPSIPRFGPGEAEAIPLAAFLGFRLLINEHRAATYAVGLGVRVTTVPEFIIVLRERDVISDRAARRKLDRIQPITGSALLSRAFRALDQM